MKLYRLLILSSLFSCFSFFIKAQVPPAAGSYIINNTMGAFHGTWRWVRGIDTVQIYMTTKKVHFPFEGGFDWDCLVGWHFYKRGNTIIENNYNYINNVEQRSFEGGNGANNGEPAFGYVSAVLKDPAKHKSGHLTLTLNAAQNQLTWKLENPEGMLGRKPTDPPFDYGFTLPKNMVLIKQ